jgi:hypothetical protein
LIKPTNLVAGRRLGRLALFEFLPKATYDVMREIHATSDPSQKKQPRDRADHTDKRLILKIRNKTEDNEGNEDQARISSFPSFPSVEEMPFIVKSFYLRTIKRTDERPSKTIHIHDGGAGRSFGRSTC